MNRLHTALTATAAAFFVVSLNVSFAAGPGAPRADLPRGWLVKFKPGITQAQMEAQLAAPGLIKGKRLKAPRKAHNAPVGRWWQVTPEQGRGGVQALRRLARGGLIERIEPNHVVKASALPDDPRFAEQWGLHNIGQSGGIADADVDAPEAWDFHSGSSEVIVAVMDTGIDWTHPDLAANIWTNPGEIPDNGIDDDGNGYIDDVHGHDVAGWFRFEGWPNAMDDSGHGTHLAGIIGAVGNNGAGIAGVSWRVRLMSVKALAYTNTGFMSDVIDGMLYAAEMGARIVVTGLSTNENSDALADAIAALNEMGVLVVAAAGNEGLNNETARSLPSGFGRFPASANAPNVLSVAATTPGDGLAPFSNYGPTSVHIGAPGVGILSTVPTTVPSPLLACCTDPSGYRLADGTSTSAAFVAGAAALLLAQDPARTPQQIQRLLWASSDPLAALEGRVASNGRLNIANALSCVPGAAHSARLVAPADSFKAYPQLKTRIVADVASCGAGVTGASVTVSFSTGEAAVILYDDGAHGDGAAGDGIYANDWSPAVEGAVILKIHAALPGREVTRSVSGSVRHLTSYRYEGAPYEWIDTAGGTPHTFTWMSVATSPMTVPIGFDFNFYGVNRNSLTISLNGYVTFDAQPLNSLFWMRNPMPDWFPPNDVIAAYGDIFDFMSEAVIYTLLEGDAPNRRLTITWPNVKHAFASGHATFQMTLYEDSNDIVFRYQDTTVGDAFSYDHGRDAAVGTEDVDAFEATQYPGLVPEGTALRFYQAPYNYAPLANAGGPYTGIARQPVTLDGSRSSDPNGDPLTYQWKFGDGSSGTGVNPSHAYLAKGRYTATLVVSDGLRQSAPVTSTIDIPNHPPLANAGGPYSGLGNTLITFNGSGSSDIDGDFLSHRWTVADAAGKTYPFFGSSGFFPPGAYTVTLVVNDGTADSAPSRTTMTLANQAPWANAGPDAKYPRGTRVTLQGSFGDPDGQVVTVAWRQISGQPVALTKTDSIWLDFVIPKSFKEGNLVFELTVTDNFGAKGSDQATIIVTR